MASEIQNKVRDFVVTANHLDNAARLSDDVSEETWLAAMTEITLKAQGELLEICADLSDAEAARLERKSIMAAETACDGANKERVAA
jgi:cob(I)alamin adenosyltransferase